MKKILVTGGAGFIGSYTVDQLIEKGYKVRIFDNLEPQVHGNKKPDYINQNAEFVVGDVTNKNDFFKALSGVDAVIHLAAMVGVGQSMYQPIRYLNVNINGTANMYEIIIEKKLPIQKIIVASSMSTYGEGAYLCDNCGVVYPSLRSKEQLEKNKWEMYCTNCSEQVKPIPTQESKPQQNVSTYALSKYVQEILSLNYGFTLNIPTAALRYFNVYGPRQSLNNPYTGVAAIFSSRIKNNKPPVIYEDGIQTRDFIFVEDIARANVLVLENFDGVGVFNVGSGNAISVLDVANTLIKLYNSSVQLEITQKFRPGDVRHCFSDISKIKKELGFKPQTDLKEGFKKLVEWGETEEAVDKFESAEKERMKYLGK